MKSGSIFMKVRFIMMISSLKILTMGKHMDMVKHKIRTMNSRNTKEPFKMMYHMDLVCVVTFCDKI